MSGSFSFEGRFTQETSDDAYTKVFSEAGLGQVGDDPEAVATRVKASSIRAMIVAALDDWAARIKDAPRRSWLLAVAQKADLNLTSWRSSARDPATWESPETLSKLLETAPIDSESLPLLLAIEKYLNAYGREPIPFMMKMQRANPGDFLTNFNLGYRLCIRNKQEEGMAYYRAALALRPTDLSVIFHLANTLIDTGHADEGCEYLRDSLRFEPAFSKNRYNYLRLIRALISLGKHDEAFTYLQSALRESPNDAQIHYWHGEYLDAKRQDVEAIAEYRLAIALDSKLAEAHRGLRKILFRRGDFNEIRVAWRKTIEVDPSNFTTTNGYAEFCLFIGDNSEYHRECQSMLDYFGYSDLPQENETMGRACLLAPASLSVTLQAVKLIDRALADKNKSPEWTHHYFNVAKALAEYRLDHFESVLSLLKGDKAATLMPLPLLILAMAHHRLGHKEEALKTLVIANSSIDWGVSHADNREAWMFHILRREAEQLILPEITAFLEGRYQPKTNNERIALVGVCQSSNRTLALARLYADCFKASPSLAEDLEYGIRHRAAFAAALVGCGRGVDSAELGENDRKQWREQARQWLQADLNGWKKRLQGASARSHDIFRASLTRWRESPDLAGLRDPDELKKLSDEERKDCVALWDQVNALLKPSK